MSKEFALAAFKSLGTVGAVYPSSKYLARKMTKRVKRDLKSIVELGAGTGTITSSIIEQAGKTCRINSFEIDSGLYVGLSSDPIFSRYDNLHFHLASAFDFRRYLDSAERPDLIISSLPLAILPKPQVIRMLLDAKEVLRPGGVFVQYQYSPESFSMLKRIFSKVETSVELRNIPPALIYTCSI